MKTLKGNFHGTFIKNSKDIFMRHFNRMRDFISFQFSYFKDFKGNEL